jgi:hypothetical protein
MALGLYCASHRSSIKDQDDWGIVLGEISKRVNASTFYTGVLVEENELLENVSFNDMSWLYQYAYQKGMIQNRANKIVIKEHQAWRLAEFFLDCFPDSKIVIQVRDPRDHAVSCKKLGKLYSAYHGSISRAARMWVIDQSNAIKLIDKFGSDRVRVHKYEDLVQNSKETLLGLCNFLEIEWSDSMFDYHLAQANKKKISEKYLSNMWANLDRPIKTNSVGQWKTKLNRAELQIIQREVGSLLTTFGYDQSPCNYSKIGSMICSLYQACDFLRYILVTVFIWCMWLLFTRDYRVPFNILCGNAVRAHHPYEYFRDRFGFRL